MIVLRLVAWARARRTAASRGQSMVEMALILPIFVLLLIGLVEFSVMFSIIINVNYASRDGALMAAEVGDNVGGDCLILQRIDAALSAVTHHSDIIEVRIFRADANGVELAANSYSEGGATTCTFATGGTVTVPFSAETLNYPASDRCAVLAGCGGSHPGVDSIGVSIRYHHDWLTPLPNLVQITPTGVDFTRSNTMRMEPVL